MKTRLLLLAAMAGCASPSVDSVSSAIGNSTTIDASCTPSQQTRLTDALTRLNAFLTDTTAAGAGSIMLAEPMTGVRRSPEFQLGVLTANRPTVIRCTSLTYLYGQPVQGTQSGVTDLIDINGSVVDDVTDYDTDQLAGFVGEGLSLAEGMGGALGFMNTPDTIEDGLILHGTFNTVRAGFSGDTELPLVGIPAGKDFTLTCGGAHEWVRGLVVELQSGVVSSLRTVCDHSASAAVGTTGTQHSNLRCASNELLVGISADDDGGFLHLVAHCALEKDVARYNPKPMLHDLSAGSAGIPTLTRMCYPGQAVRRIHGYVAGQPNSLQIACQDYVAEARGEFTHGPRVATSAGTLAVVSAGRCFGFGTVAALDGYWSFPDNASSPLRRLEVMCNETELSPNGVPMYGYGDHFFDDFSADQEPLAGYQRATCNAAEAMVGIHGLAAGGTLVGVKAECAVRADWYGSLATVPTVMRGNVAPSLTATYKELWSECPRSTEIAGMKLEAGVNGNIGALTPLCRQLTPVP